MRQPVLRSFAITLLVFVLSGCDSLPFMESKSEYKGAGRSKPLEVPPDLTSVRSSSSFNVPGTAVYSASAMSQNPETEEQSGLEPVLADVKNVRMVKAGSQRWLVVNASPEKIWPVVRNFWLDQGFAVRVENPDIGLMETEWLDSDAIKPKEDNRGYREKFDNWLDGLSGLADRRKFRTRLEHGEKEGTTEIYMTHLTVASAPDDGKNYVVTMLGKVDTGYRPDAQEKKNTGVNQFDNDLDAELLRRLMVKLGLSEASADNVAAQAAPDKHADVVKESDQSVTLKLNEPFDRAWRRVGLALDRIGFVTEDKNRSEGIFYVRYADSEAEDPIKVKKGLLERLKFWKSDDEEKTADGQTQPPKQMDKSKFWNGTSDGDKSSKQYRIQVLENAGDTSDVYVLTQENKRNTTTTANRIISLLYDQLK